MAELMLIFCYRVTEGSEHILFREKFSDWPEQGRIIKMKGHVSSGEVQVRSFFCPQLAILLPRSLWRRLNP